MVCSVRHEELLIHSEQDHLDTNYQVQDSVVSAHQVPSVARQSQSQCQTVAEKGALGCSAVHCSVYTPFYKYLFSLTSHQHTNPNINRGMYVPACVPATVWHTMSGQSRVGQNRLRQSRGQSVSCVMSRQSCARFRPRII